MTEREGDDFDELLQPTVTQAAPSGHLPWRLHSQFWVAFFGGIPAVTAIAWINARYLGMPAPSRRLILACGGAALAIYAGLAGSVFLTEPRSMRIAGRLLAVALFLGLSRLQRESDARHQLFGSGDYASLWRAGIAASVAGNLILFAIHFGLHAALR